MIWEIPAGGLDTKEEPSLTCAHRELLEETGCTTEDMEFLIRINTTVAFCSEFIDIFVAKNLKNGSQHLDDGEFLEVSNFSISELEEMIYSGEITDSKTVAGLMCYKSKYLTK